MNIRTTTVRYCKWCGKPFEVKSPNQKYCPISISDCSKEAKRESWRKAAKKYRENYKDNLHISQVYKLGSGLLGCSPQTNFDEEYRAIQKEKKRLKLSCMSIGLSFGIQFTEDFVEIMLKRNLIPIFKVYPQLLILVLILVGIAIFGIYHK